MDIKKGWSYFLSPSLQWFLSPIERKKGRLQAACRFGLLLLFYRGLFAVLLPWGLRYNRGLRGLLPRCGLYSSM
jgi:hypothetical protein